VVHVRAGGLVFRVFEGERPTNSSSEDAGKRRVCAIAAVARSRPKLDWPGEESGMGQRKGSIFCGAVGVSTSSLVGIEKAWDAGGVTRLGKESLCANDRGGRIGGWGKRDLSLTFNRDLDLKKSRSPKPSTAPMRTLLT